MRTRWPPTRIAPVQGSGVEVARQFTVGWDFNDDVTTGFSNQICSGPPVGRQRTVEIIRFTYTFVAEPGGGTLWAVRLLRAGVFAWVAARTTAIGAIPAGFQFDGPFVLLPGDILQAQPFFATVDASEWACEWTER